MFAQKFSFHPTFINNDDVEAERMKRKINGKSTKGKKGKMWKRKEIFHFVLSKLLQIWNLICPIYTQTISEWGREKFVQDIKSLWLWPFCVHSKRSKSFHISKSSHTASARSQPLQNDLFWQSSSASRASLCVHLQWSSPTTPSWRSEMFAGRKWKKNLTP